MAILPISKFITVILSQTPSGLAVPNVNSTAIFTTETPGNLDPYRIYNEPTSIAKDYGSNSETYAMANNLFSQVPNPLSGNGQLIIAPMLAAVSADAGDFITTNISANLAALIAIDDGDLKVTLNGVAINLAGLDFTTAVTLVDIAAILQSKLPDAIVSATSTAITIASKTVGTVSTVALAAYSGGGTDLTGSGLLNTAAGSQNDGRNATGETLVEAVNRLLPQVQFIPIQTNLKMENAVVETSASAFQALDIIWFVSFAATTDIAGICTTIRDASQDHTRCLLYTPSIADATLMQSAYNGRGISTDFAGSNTTQTLNGKSLINVVPDPGMDLTLSDQADLAGADIYGSVGGAPCVLSSGANNYFDNIYNEIAFKLNCQIAGFNYLRQTNTKIPQTESGMDGLKGAYGAVCRQFINNGMLAPGTWNGAIPFGDPADFVRNIQNFGYYIYSQPIATQSQSDRAARKAPLVQIAVKLAGAIHSSTLIIEVQP